MFFHFNPNQGPGPKQQPEDLSGPAIIDGKGLFTKLADDPSLPVGQLYLETHIGLVDYNDLIEKVTNVKTPESNTVDDTGDGPASAD